METPPSRRFRGLARSSSFVFLPSFSDNKYSKTLTPHDATLDHVTTDSLSIARCRADNA